MQWMVAVKNTKDNLRETIIIELTAWAILVGGLYVIIKVTL